MCACFWCCTWFLQLIFLAAVTPIVHDFYNYDLASPEYVHQFNQFLKVIQSCLTNGSLLSDGTSFLLRFCVWSFGFSWLWWSRKALIDLWLDCRIWRSLELFCFSWEWGTQPIDRSEGSSHPSLRFSKFRTETLCSDIRKGRYEGKSNVVHTRLQSLCPSHFWTLADGDHLWSFFWVIRWWLNGRLAFLWAWCLFKVIVQQCYASLMWELHLSMNDREIAMVITHTLIIRSMTI